MLYWWCRWFSGKVSESKVMTWHCLCGLTRHKLGEKIMRASSEIRAMSLQDSHKCTRCHYGAEDFPNFAGPTAGTDLNFSRSSQQFVRAKMWQPQKKKKAILLPLSHCWWTCIPPLSEDPEQSKAGMTFLMLSVDYPSDKDRSKFVKKAGPHAKNSNPFHKPLAASATDDEWRRVLKAIKESVTDTSFLYEQPSPRPLRPNDDNYEAFTGSKWKPEGSIDFGGRDPSVVRALSAMMGQQDDTNTPYPRYDRCANCTKLLPKMSRCSRCKIVKYCSRDCQSSHWKKVHKQSCVKAQPFTLYKSMNGNDGFLMTPDECKGLAEALSEHESIHSDDVVRCYQAYFTVAADLGGCFIL